MTRKKKIERDVKAPDEGQRPLRYRHYLAVLLIAVATAFAYSSALHGTWAMDDDLISQYTSAQKSLSFRMGYRKIAALSFLFNQWIDPLSPVNYRVVNIGIHVINALLVYLLAMVTLKLCDRRGNLRRIAFPAALFSGLVFALHPININAVSYIVQRMAALSALFTLLALLLYIKARTGGRAGLFLYGMLTVLAILCAVFSKENGVMAVPLLLLYDFFFITEGDRKKFLVKGAAGFGIGLLSLGVVSALLNLHVGSLLEVFLHPNRPVPVAAWTAADVSWTPVQHILTEFRVLSRYLMLFVAPLPGLFVFDWWGFPLSTGLTTPPSTLLAAVLIIGLIGFAIFSIRRLPYLSFGILWYFTAISLESFVAVGSDLYYEHRNYLPVAGLIMGLVCQGLVSSWSRSLRDRKVWIIALIATLVLGGLTYKRNLVWADSLTLWGDTIAKAPGNARALMAMGNAHLKVSDFTDAADYYKKAIEITSAGGKTQYLHDSLYSLAMLYLSSGNRVEAGKIIDRIERTIEGSVKLDFLKGFYLALNNNDDGAIELYRSALRRTKALDKVLTYTLLGDALRRKGLADEALENYRAALELDPSFSAACYGISAVYMLRHDLPDARTYLEKTLALDPYNVLALADMADILLMTGAPPADALALAERAVAKSPPFYQPYLSMANVLTVMGREGEAGRYYGEAEKKGIPVYMVLLGEARAYYIKGEKKKAEELFRKIAAMPEAPEALRRSVAANIGKN